MAGKQQVKDKVAQEHFSLLVSKAIDVLESGQELGDKLFALVVKLRIRGANLRPKTFQASALVQGTPGSCLYLRDHTFRLIGAGIFGNIIQLIKINKHPPSPSTDQSLVD